MWLCICVLNKRSCLALKSSRSICFSSSILRVWVYIFVVVVVAVHFCCVALNRRTREMYNNFDNIFRNVIFCVQLFFFQRKIFFLLLRFVCLFFTRPQQWIFIFSFFFPVSYFGCFSCWCFDLYIFMVKMHLIYDCDGYSSFTGTNSFHIHIS